MVNAKLQKNNTTIPIADSDDFTNSMQAVLSGTSSATRSIGFCLKTTCIHDTKSCAMKSMHYKVVFGVVYQ